jgi:DNA primase
LLYGNKQVSFADWTEEVNEQGLVKMVKEEYTSFVSQEIYVQLQMDEVEFSHPVFQNIYSEIILKMNQETTVSIEELTSHSDVEISNIVTDILMDDEKHLLSNWEAQEIYVTAKDEVLPKLVRDAILNLRRVMIERKIEDLIQDVADDKNREATLEMVVNYTDLRKKMFEKLHRIV